MELMVFITEPIYIAPPQESSEVFMAQQHRGPWPEIVWSTNADKAEKVQHVKRCRIMMENALIKSFPHVITSKAHYKSM